MTMLQLNPPIPVTCAKGNGHAMVVLDYSQEHDSLFLVALDETGELWWLPNSQIRMQKNISLNRINNPQLRNPLNEPKSLVEKNRGSR